MSLIAVRGVRFTYPASRREALDGISFSVEPGEHIALVGPNGSGKSTLFSLLAGFLPPDAGTVFLGGREVAAWPARLRARRLALVPQGRQPGFPYTCLELVLMGLHPWQEFFSWPGDAALAQAENLMRRTGVWDKASKPVTALSGGELQRVILTRALLQLLNDDDDPPGGGTPAPKILLLDEALSELDINARMAMMKLLHEISRTRGIAVIGIHHDLHLAWRFAGRIIALREGRLAGDGTPDEVFTRDFFAGVFHIDAEIVPGKGFFFRDEIIAEETGISGGAAGNAGSAGYVVSRKNFQGEMHETAI